MLKEKGIVTKIDGDMVWVNTQSKLACSSCQVEATCGNGILEKYLSGKVFVSKLKNDISARLGDQVEIAVAKSSVTKASLLIYTLPLMCLIFSALFVDWWLGSEIYTIIGSIAGFISGLLVTQFYNRKLMQDENFQPRIIAKKSITDFSQDIDLIEIKQLD